MSNILYHRPPYNCNKCKDKNWLKQCVCGKCNEVITLSNYNYVEKRFKSGHNSYLIKHTPKKGSNSHSWKGGRHEKNRYTFILMPWHPNANKQGYIREHVWIMSRYLGRPLDKGEIVHHINECPDDNRIENLMLLPNNTEHRKLHRIDKSGRTCSNIECPNPFKTILHSKNKTPIWAKDGKGGYWCNTCYKREIYRRKKGWKCN